MPNFPWLFDNTLTGKLTERKMLVLKKLGVPYTEEDMAGAKEAVEGKKEIDALIAYLQQLGTVLSGR